MNKLNHILAKGKPEFTSLYDHLMHVVTATIKVADSLNMDIDIARQGAILHDIGKVSTVFQSRLKKKQHDFTEKPFRHEIASLFFLSLFDEQIHSELIEMIIAHHKSIAGDAKGRGILDLTDQFEESDETNAVFEMHAVDWDIWSKDALKLLGLFDIPVREITLEEAKANYLKVREYSQDIRKVLTYSEWKGLLMSGDHFASALVNETEKSKQRLFKKT